jgi:hypothetical protein
VRKTPAVIALVLTAALTACGGSSTPPAGQSQAAAACKTGGSQAASLAAQAAALNPRFATLSADEAALAANEAQTQAAVSDDGTDDGGGIAGATGLGTSGSFKIITDCTSLGLSVTP